jgi:hypothetical protein
MKVTEDNFDEVFKPQINHLDNNASFNGCMYETFGEELDYVFSLANTNRVWTIVEGDDDTMFYCAGFHYVNRIGFLVCEVEYEDGQEDIQLDTDF